MRCLVRSFELCPTRVCIGSHSENSLVAASRNNYAMRVEIATTFPFHFLPGKTFFAHLLTPLQLRVGPYNDSTQLAERAAGVLPFKVIVNLWEWWTGSLGVPLCTDFRRLCRRVPLNHISSSFSSKFWMGHCRISSMWQRWESTRQTQTDRWVYAVAVGDGG